MDSTSTSPAGACRPAPNPGLTVLDWVGVAITLSAASGLASFPVLVVPTFRGMFVELGGTLPWLTSQVLTLWWAPAIALVASDFVIIGVALHRELGLGYRRLLIVAGFLVVVAGFGSTLAGIYWPVWQMAGAIKG